MVKFFNSICEVKIACEHSVGGSMAAYIVDAWSEIYFKFGRVHDEAALESVGIAYRHIHRKDFSFRCE